MNCACGKLLPVRGDADGQSRHAFALDHGHTRIESSVVASILNAAAGMGGGRAVAVESGTGVNIGQAQHHMGDVDRRLPGQRDLRAAPVFCVNIGKADGEMPGHDLRNGPGHSIRAHSRCGPVVGLIHAARRASSWP